MNRLADMPAPETSRCYPSGDLAVWIFILAELAVFALFFVAYAYTRSRHVALFNEYQNTLDRDTALLNTLALITASYFVVRAVASIREDDAPACARWLWSAFAMGGLFLLLKGSEYAHHMAQGINLGTNTFYMFYLSLTFFHFMHVILGMIVLAVLAVRAGQGHYAAERHNDIESGGNYWHMVDLVWLILFPLVYVMR